MIEKNDLINILKNWNIWENEIDVGIKRGKYINEIYPYIKRKEILVLKGIRRCGKSTIMKQLIYELVKKGVHKKQILYLNLEDYNFKDSLNLKLFEEVLEVYLKYSKNKKITYFFIDEIQNIEGWERFVRTIYDQGKKIKFILSGSNASLLSKELSTLLTGRNITFQIKILTLKEYFSLNKNGSIEEYMTYGGFPEVVLESEKLTKKIILQQYFEDIINKDIISRNKIRNIELVFNLSRNIIANSGTKTSLNKLAKTYGVSDTTISTYISYMQDSFLISKVPFFSYSLKKRHNVLMKPKYYATDNGFVYVSNLNFSKNIGKMYEMAVFLKLYDSIKNISYWAEKGEVDFVLENQGINVTSTNNIDKREYEGLLEFKKKFKSNIGKMILITKSISKIENGIEYVPLKNWLLE